MPAHQPTGRIAEPMRIAIVGSGGLGGYFGARLAAGGSDVHFLARGAHLAAMREQGIAIEGGPDPIHVPGVHATDDPAEIDQVDLALIAVKLWDTESVLQHIRPVVGPDTTVLSCQNGVLKDFYLRAAFPERQLIGGVAYVATTIDRPGVIRQTGPMQRLVFGEFDGSHARRALSVFSKPVRTAGLQQKSPTTSNARSGRSLSSWSASPGRRPP